MQTVEVLAVQIVEPRPPGIAAFAIDQPRPGDIGPGRGLEINGWVIGDQTAVQGVRTLTEGRGSRVYPLDIERPDVAADYPGHVSAGSSGFAAWATVEAPAKNVRLTVEAVFAGGSTRPLANVFVSTTTSVTRDRTEGRFPVSAPDFVIIGAQRGGTTSLHAWLGAHPQVETPATKELHFLTDRYERGREWYLGQFPPPRNSMRITGEATPYALFHPLAPQRLREIAPHAKLVALLRNPIDRAYSQYLHERAHGFESLDFAAALDAEPVRLAGEEERLVRNPGYVSDAHKHFSYLARGDYAPQIRRWFAHVPREHLLIVRSEDLYARPHQAFATVATFLGIAPGLDAPLSAYNRSTGPPLDPATRARLTDHFAPRNARLADLLGWDPGWESAGARLP